MKKTMQQNFDLGRNYGLLTILDLNQNSVASFFFIYMPRTYPESFWMIAKKLCEKIDFGVWKSVICGKSRLKIVRTIELHIGTDLQLAITLARINIFSLGKKQLVDIIPLFQKIT